MTLGNFLVEIVDPQAVCKCQAFTTCSWSKSLQEKLKALPINHPNRTNLIQLSRNQIRNQVCNKEEKHVWCCRDGEAANESELSLLSGTKL